MCRMPRAANLAERVSSASPRPAPDLRIMDLLTRSRIHQIDLDYLDILVNDTASQGREVLTKYKAQFDATESLCVDRYAIAAIWASSQLLDQMAIAMCLAIHRDLGLRRLRQKLSRDEFLSALEILHRGDLRPEQMRAPGQRMRADAFMPTASSVRGHADGDGRRDVVDDPRLIASTRTT